MTELRIAAHAKVNLCLSVGPPRPSGEVRGGWHPIASWMHAVGLADDVVLTRSEGPAELDLAVAPDAPAPFEIDWPAERDLAMRACRAVEARVGRALPVKITVRKRIPPGAGLGGGSSDAAAVIRGLDLFFGLGLGPGSWAELGGRLGSDVAFFLDEQPVPRPAIVTGFGEAIERLAPATGRSILILVPGFGCSTPEVYRAYDGVGPRPLSPGRVRAAAMAPGGPRDADLFNDLAGAAFRVRPELAGIVSGAAERLARPCHVTGSGSGVFVLDPPPGASVPGVSSVGTLLV